MRLRSVVGDIELNVWHGLDPSDEHWGCPIREIWRLGSHHEPMTPELEQRLAFTASATGSYEEAARVAQRWGCPSDDSVIHRLVQRIGKQAQANTKKRLETLPQESHPQRTPSQLGVLLMDGWMARFRGPGWGKEKPQEERVGWHEVKTGVFYKHEQAARTQSERGIITEKVIVRLVGEPMELGQRLGWEALRAGLGRAQNTLVLADGGKWIWNVVEDRWQHAYQILDFYHASQHLWTLGRALCLQNETLAKDWVERRLHQLRHGQEQMLLAELATLPAGTGENAEIVEKEKKYFESQSKRMSYQWIADRGWPIGSGAVESTCRQSQCRFKRPGQFWSEEGFGNLNALDEARHNNYWDELWTN
jgi:hypothetical protein